MAQRSARFLVKSTKESRFLQSQRESDRRLKKFRINKLNRHKATQRAARWVDALLKEAV